MSGGQRIIIPCDCAFDRTKKAVENFSGETSGVG